MAAVAAPHILRRLHPFELAGRVALVTGGSRGLGFAVARELVTAGARVAVCARDEARLERARELLGGDVLAVPCDVGDRAEVDALVARIEAELGPVELLVNNAGVISVGPLPTQDVAEFEQALATQLWGLVNCTLAVLPVARRAASSRRCGEARRRSRSACTRSSPRVSQASRPGSPPSSWARRTGCCRRSAAPAAGAAARSTRRSIAPASSRSGAGPPPS